MNELEKSMAQQCWEMLKLIGFRTFPRSLGASLDWFADFFGLNVVFTTANIVKLVAYALLIFNVIYHLYKTMFTNSSRAENPLKMILLTGVSMFFIEYIYEIAGYVGKFFTDIINQIDDAFNSDFINFEGASAWQTVGNGIDNLVYCIIFCVLIIQYLKLLVLYCKRYLELCLNIILFPAAFSAFPVEGTRDITKSYVRTFLSAFLSLAVSLIFLFLYSISMCKTLSLYGALGWMILGTVFTKAIGELFMEIERWLNSLGLTNADMYHDNPLATLGAVASTAWGLTGGAAIKGLSGATFGALGKKTGDAVTGKLSSGPSVGNNPLSKLETRDSTKISEQRQAVSPQAAADRLSEAMAGKIQLSQGAANDYAQNAFNGQEVDARDNKAFLDKMNKAANNGQKEQLGRLNNNGKMIPVKFDSQTGAATIQGSKGITEADKMRESAGISAKNDAKLDANEMAQIAETTGLTKSLGTGFSGFQSIDFVQNDCMHATLDSGQHVLLERASSKDIFGEKASIPYSDVVAMPSPNGGQQYFRKRIMNEAVIAESGKATS